MEEVELKISASHSALYSSSTGGQIITKSIALQLLLSLCIFLKASHSPLHMKRGKFCWFFITTDEEKFCSVMDILQVNPCRVYLLSLEKVTGAEISPTLPCRVTIWLEKVNISRLHNIEFYVQPSNYVNSSHFIKRNIIRWSNVSQHPTVIAFLEEKNNNFAIFSTTFFIIFS